MALVEARLDLSLEFDDFVEGKGKGLNILLQYGFLYTDSLHNGLTYKSGPPGVGKTFTAEAVSEHLKRPLYSVGFSFLYLAKHKPNRLDLYWGITSRYNRTRRPTLSNLQDRQPLERHSSSRRSGCLS
jgi:hypothetical protein